MNYQSTTEFCLKEMFINLFINRFSSNSSNDVFCMMMIFVTFWLNACALFCWWDPFVLTRSFCFKDVSCSPSTRLCHSDAGFECGTRKCFHAARERQRHPSYSDSGAEISFIHVLQTTLWTTPRPCYDVRNKPLMLSSQIKLALLFTLR